MRQTLDLKGNKVTTRNCVVPDHSVVSFNLSIRTNNRITAAMVEEFLQRKWEVTECKETEGTIYIK
jgi:hypothetical protein